MVLSTLESGTDNKEQVRCCCPIIALLEMNTSRLLLLKRCLIAALGLWEMWKHRDQLEEMIMIQTRQSAHDGRRIALVFLFCALTLCAIRSLVQQTLASTSTAAGSRKNKERKKFRRGYQAAVRHVIHQLFFPAKAEALHKACHQFNVAAIRRLVDDEGVDVNCLLFSASSMHRLTPLESLVHDGYSRGSHTFMDSDNFLACLECLLAAGAVPRFSKQRGWTSLMEKACEQAAYKALGQLLRSPQFSLERSFQHPSVPLMMLSMAFSHELNQQGYLEALELMLMVGYRAPCCSSLLHFLCANGASVAIDILCRYNVNVSEDGEEYIEIAFRHDDFALLRVLAANGARIHSTFTTMQAVNFLLRTIWSLSFSVIEKVETCLQAGLDPNCGTKDGDSFLQRYVKTSGRHRPVQGVLPMMLKYGALINLPTVDGITPLMMACQGLNHHILNELIGHGADIAARDNCGRTCLFYSLKDSMYAPSFWKALISAGVDLEARCNLSRTALHEASMFLGSRRLQSLLELGVDKSSTDRHGWTILHYASFAGRLPSLTAVLEAGVVDVNVRDAKGRTPLHVFGLKDYAKRERQDMGTFIENLLKSDKDDDAAGMDVEVLPCADDMATRYGALQKLLDAGADPLAFDDDGNLPFATMRAFSDLGSFNRLFATVQNAAARGLSSAVLF